MRYSGPQLRVVCTGERRALLVIFVVFAWLHVGVHFVAAFHHDVAVVVNGRIPAGEVEHSVLSPLVRTWSQITKERIVLQFSS